MASHAAVAKVATARDTIMAKTLSAFGDIGPWG